MKAQLELSMQNNTQDLIRAMGEAAAFLDSLSLPSRVLYKANLVLEEILTNIVKYAFPDCAVHDVAVHVTLHGEELVIQFVEDGCEFDPLSIPQPPMADSVLDCPVGGLGIHLVCKTVDRIEYRRDQEKNILTVALKLEPQA
jgi:anti-sigma regulatory factor (Ser/Thr protein kinase)